MYSTKTHPKPTRDGSLTLYSERYGESFHSDRGALSESRHVFLAASGVASRLAAGSPTRVLEVGFGTGLNFFLSADLALTGRTALSYVGLERSVLPGAALRPLGYREHLSHPELFGAYLTFRAALAEQVAPGRYRFAYGSVTLELRVGEANEQSLTPNSFDAVYQDAFSPDANPELWNEDFLETLYRTLKPGGALSTYSVKGSVRRRLTALGFVTEKLPGPPGGKREMLRAFKPTPEPNYVGSETGQ